VIHPTAAAVANIAASIGAAFCGAAVALTVWG
jgi:hypothetical protein